MASAQEPRIPPLPAAEYDERQAELMQPFGAAPLNIFATLVRHPRLFRRWSSFGSLLLGGVLEPRDRELLIIRTGWVCGSEYEFAQHVAFGKAAGLTADEIERVKAGPDAGGWSRDDAALLRAADELHADSVIADATWAALAERLDDQQLIEVPMVVGQYHLVAFTLRSLGVALEDGVAGDFQV